MCGEKMRMLIEAAVAEGSPPHVRGKVNTSGISKAIVGITPACAGKSLYSGRYTDTGQDHPRMCGEKQACPKALPSTTRITPACAGKSGHRSGKHNNTQDHPRMCGEKEALQADPGESFGSPPHVRGKVCVQCVSSDERRITPACAGKSSMRPAAHSKQRDHPRMCGEKSAPEGRHSTLTGSPPHVRGKD